MREKPRKHYPPRRCAGWEHGPKTSAGKLGLNVAAQGTGGKKTYGNRVVFWASEFATTPWAELRPGFCAWGIGEQHPPRSPGYRWQEKRLTSTDFSEASPAPCTKGPAGMRGSGAGGRALLLLMWQSFPAEGRQNAHDSFFQEMLQTIVTMPLVGMNVKRHDGGGSHAGHLVCGLPTEGTATNKTCWSQFLALCATRALPARTSGEEGQNGCPANSSPHGILSACDGYQPRLQPKRGPVLLPGEKNGKNNPKRFHPHVGLEQEQAGNLGKHYSALRLLSPSSCLCPPHKFSIFRCCPRGTASKPFESLTFHCCLFDTIIFRHTILKTYQHLK